MYIYNIYIYVYIYIYIYIHQKKQTLMYVTTVNIKKSHIFFHADTKRTKKNCKYICEA